MQFDSRLRQGSFGSDRLSALARDADVDNDVEEPLLISALGLPHPDDDTDVDEYEGFVSPRLLGGSEYVQQNMYMALWLLFLVAGYTVERVACRFGLPYDCIRSISYLEVFSDLTSLFLFGLALGWLIGINEAIRFHWLLCSRRRWYFWAFYLGTPLVYSAISNIGPLKGSIATGAHLTAPFLIASSLGMLTMLGIIAWHIIAAWKRGGSAADFWVYVGLRVTVLAWFVSAAVVVSQNPELGSIHLHHLYLGWAFALWAEFNRPVSALTLAIGCGIFVQGVAAYSFAPVFSRGGCFETPATTEVKCRFWAASPFTMQICPADGVPPSYSCAS